MVFDLDGCLWSPEMYELSWMGGGPPFKLEGKADGRILDRSGNPIKLLGDVREVLRQLHCDERWDGVLVGISSRTDEPGWARSLLKCFQFTHSGEDISLDDVFQFEEIAYDYKEQHFRRIAKKTGLPFEAMLFFDNEPGNCRDVAELGVTVGYCPGGVDLDIWNRALAAFPAPAGEVVK